MSKKILFINRFVLKIIAFVLMTFDHVGIFMVDNPNPTISTIGNILRLLGRIAFPLFVLLLVEGVRHTHSYPKYALRMGIIASVVLIAQIVIYFYFDNAVEGAYSPLLDLLCYGTILYLLNRKDKFSWLAIIPFGLVIGSYVVELIEFNTELTIYWLPTFVRSGYSIFGLIMALIMYYSYPLLKKFFMSYHMDNEGYEDGVTFRFYLNVCYSFAVLFAVAVIYLVGQIPNCDIYGVFREWYSETWALASILIIMFYSGLRGYKSKVLQYASYLYFPLHLVIIYLIFYLIG